MITVKTNAPGVKPVAGELVLVATLKQVHGASRVEVIHAGDDIDRFDLRDLHAAALSDGVAEIVRLTLEEHPDLTVDQAFQNVMGHLQDILNARLEELKAEFPDAGQ